MTESERRNLATAHRYIELYNRDIEQFVAECYTEDCRVIAMGGGVIEGPRRFLAIERAVLRAAPHRAMRLEHAHVAGDTVTVEVTLLNPDTGPDWALPFVAVLNMRDGRIAIDRSYADWSRWPGLDALTPGT
jgi:ketosteroid isomerase-like protein